MKEECRLRVALTVVSAPLKPADVDSPIMTESLLEYLVGKYCICGAYCMWICWTQLENKQIGEGGGTWFHSAPIHVSPLKSE